MGHRVKVYRLNEQGTWDDLGTGNVSLTVAEDPPEATSSLRVVVHAEVDPQRQLLFHRVESGVVYNRQGDDTIITWNDLFVKTDIALSFQEPSGCADVWREIQHAVAGLMGASMGASMGGSAGAGHPGHQSHQGMMRVANTNHLGYPYEEDGEGRFASQPGVSSSAGHEEGRASHRGGYGVGQDHSQHEVGHGLGSNVIGSSNAERNSLFPGEGGISEEYAMTRLPETPSLQNLGEIASVLAESTLFQQEAIAQHLLQPGYLKGVLDAFGMAEDLEDEEGLKAAHMVVKGAIMLNDVNLLEALFSDEFVVAVVGALEYDALLSMSPQGSELSTASEATAVSELRGRYRNFVQGDMNLKEVVPITDATSRSKIIQAHRIMYVRDTVLPKALDDSTFSTLSSMYLFNIVEVLLVLHQDQAFFRKLFDRIHQAERGSADWRDLISFLQELITLSRHIQMTQRNDILMHLSRLGLFRVMSDSLRTDDTGARHRAIDAILATAVHDPTLLRSHIQNQEDGHIIFEQMVAVLLEPSPSGLQENALDVIKILLDPDSMDSAETKDVFCGMFYDNYVSSLIETLAAGTPSALRQGGLLGEPPPPVSSLLLIVDLLSYCISQHSYRIKYCILRSNAVEIVLELLERPEKALVGAALRLLKTCLVMKDEFYVRYVLQKNIMERVLEAYLRFCRKENLIHSALLSLLDLLRRENIQSLLTACVSSALWEQVEQVECDQEITRAMRRKHEMNIGQLGGHLDDLDGLDDLDDLDGAIDVDRHGANIGPMNIHAGRVPVEGMVNVDVSNVDIGGIRSHGPTPASAEVMRINGAFEADQDEENYFSRLDDDGDGDGDGDGDDDTVGRDDEPSPSQQATAQGGADLGSDQKRIVLGDHDLLSLPRLVDYESDDDDDDTIPLSAGAKRKPTAKIQLNLGSAKLQKTVDDGGGDVEGGTGGGDVEGGKGGKGGKGDVTGRPTLA